MSCAKFGWNWQSGSGEDENVESLQTDGWTDRQQTIKKAHLSFSSGELKMKGNNGNGLPGTCIIYDEGNGL